MAILKPKDFIKSVLVDEVGSMISEHPYISFIVMGIGIEFLGKCLAEDRNDWNKRGYSKEDFKKAIESIPSPNKYEPYLASHDLYHSFRCGLVHAVAPKQQITLSSKDQLAHMDVHGQKLNLKVEDFYKDFEAACEYVIGIEFDPGNKMNEAFLQVPGSDLNLGTTVISGTTSSYSENGVLNDTTLDASGMP